MREHHVLANDKIDNQLYWALTSDLAQSLELYTHFDGSVDYTHNT